MAEEVWKNQIYIIKDAESMDDLAKMIEVWIAKMEITYRSFEITSSSITTSTNIKTIDHMNIKEQRWNALITYRFRTMR